MRPEKLVVAHGTDVLNALLRKVGGDELVLGVLRCNKYATGYREGAGDREHKNRDRDQGLDKCESASSAKRGEPAESVRVHRSVPRIMAPVCTSNVCVLPGAVVTVPEIFIRTYGWRTSVVAIPVALNVSRVTLTAGGGVVTAVPAVNGLQKPV